MVALASSCDGADATIPIDPDDIDGDGVANAVDLCPAVADPLQHDEDGDRIGDACDVCPTIADPDQSDRGERDALAFEDGVGDACDPRPSRGGDRLAALHTFATDSTTRWIGAGWSIADDRARAAGSARWEHKRAEQGDGIAARLQIASVVWMGEGARIGVAVDGNGIEGGRFCTLYADRDGDGNDELEVAEIGGGIATKQLAGAIAGPAELVLIRGIRYDGTGIGIGKILCRLITEDDDTPVELETSDGLTTGQYVLAAEEAEVEVSSLAVYASPVACRGAARACPRPDE